MSAGMSKRQLMAGYASVFASAVLMSTNGLFIKLLPWHPVVITCIRSFIAALFLLLLRLIFPPPKNNGNPSMALWAAAITFSAAMYTLVIAIRLTTAANAILLQFGAPVWAAILGWVIIREKPHWEQWGALVLVIAGLCIFFGNSFGGGAFLGDSLAVISGIFYGAQTVFLRMMKNGNTRDAMLLAHIISAIAGIPFLFIYPPSLSASSLLSISYMGIFQIGLASLLLAMGIKYISAVQAMLTTVAEPVLNPVWVLFLVGERPSPAAIAGGAVIILAVVASSLIGMRRDAPIPGRAGTS